MDDYKFYCVGHNPTKYALGLELKGQVKNVKAEIIRLKSGKWQYNLVPDIYIQGVEPSLGEAIKTVSSLVKEHPSINHLNDD